MPKKKGGKKKGPAIDLDQEGNDPAVVVKNYKAMCKHLGLDEGKENTDLIKTVSDAIAPGDTEDGPPPAGQIVISSEPSALNPGGEFLRATHTRALTCALLGAGAPDLKGGQFRQLKTLRLWRCAIGDDGAVCVAELMKLGGGAQPMALSYVSLMDNRIGPRGCAALGAALDCVGEPGPSKVVALDLANNEMIGDEGAEALCLGLRSNTVLKRLHLPFCNVGAAGARAIAQAICMPTGKLEHLMLTGNRLGAEGLRNLSDGLRRSKALQVLDVSDNRISGEVELLAHFAHALTVNKSLTSIKMHYNHIGIEGASVLQPALTAENKQINQFWVDSTLPTEIFDTLYRAGGAAGKGKKKKGKKKK